MSETNPIPATAEKQKPADAIPDAVLNWGIGSLLNAQADMLADAESTASDWLLRRQEAVADARQLIANMHTGTDPGGALKAQREFVSRSLRRLAADADACQTLAQRLMHRAPAWFPHGAWSLFARNADSTESTASQAAATRAAGKPLRMANGSD